MAKSSGQIAYSAISTPMENWLAPSSSAYSDITMRLPLKHA